MTDPADGAVEVDPACEGLAAMLAGLLRANVAADPEKARTVRRTRGTALLEVTDADEVVVLRFGDGCVHVSTAGPAGAPAADVRVVGTADAIMGLSTTPLRFGLPDLLSAGGRRLAGRWVVGGIEVHGLPRGALLLRAVLQLLSVLS